jgi:alpha-D-ribose 1-methylphosphonate 5-triphosphate synthase subunit PhnG
MKALRKNQKEMLEIKNTNRRKDAFHELIISGPGTGMVSLREGVGGGGRQGRKEEEGKEGGRGRRNR